jgi:hypothetical protein
MAVELVVEEFAELDLPWSRGFEAIGANGFTRRTMPKQERKPCSGCGRRSGISSHKDQSRPPRHGARDRDLLISVSPLADTTSPMT